MSGVSKRKRLLAFLLGVCTICYVYPAGLISSNFVNLQTLRQVQRAGKQYISPLCSCNKVIAVQNEEALNQSDAFHWCSLEADLRGDHQRVITYTLYGDVHNKSIFSRYYAQMRNLSMTVRKEYPGWVIRLYHAFELMEQEAFKPLCDIYCEFPHVDLCSVVEMYKSVDESKLQMNSDILRGLNRKMYRFLAMLDPRVDVFISRDIDSLIYRREVAAVEQWLQSDYTFHFMIDSPFHKDVILAGMWGAKNYRQRHLVDRLGRALVVEGQNENDEQDQLALRSILWPIAKIDMMMHDSYQCMRQEIYSPSKAWPFPTRRENGYFVGAIGPQRVFTKCPAACRPPDHQDWEYC